MPAANWRFGTTAARSANLKSSGEMPPLRQAAGTLAVSVESVVEKVSRLEIEVHFESDVEKN